MEQVNARIDALQLREAILETFGYDTIDIDFNEIRIANIQELAILVILILVHEESFHNESSGYDLGVSSTSLLKYRIKGIASSLLNDYSMAYELILDSDDFRNEKLIKIANALLTERPLQLTVKRSTFKNERKLFTHYFNTIDEFIDRDVFKRIMQFINK